MTYQARVRWLSLVVVALGLATVACGSDPSVAALPLADARITIVQADGARHELAMTKAGAVSFDGVGFATVTTKGRLRIGGEDVMRLVKDGAVLVRGQPSNIALDARDGFIENGAVVLTVDDAGAIEGALWAELEHPKFTGEGATVTYKGPATGRRALMFALAAFLTAQSIPAK